jgi:hypothetical protein
MWPFSLGATSSFQKENRALSHAAYLAMDRLVIQDTATVLGKLQAQPELMTGREPTRANFFARADVADPAQKTILEKYLGDRRLSGAELETFAGLYPNANYMISHNLLTQVSTPNGGSLRARDQQALQVVQGWLEDPRFQRILEGFVHAQAAGSGN